MLQLPQDSIPSHYDVQLHLDPESPTFKGSVTITVESTSDTIVLNSVDLAITETRVNGCLTTTEYDAARQIILVSSQGHRGTLKLAFKVSGQYNKHNQGIYKTTDNGKTLISTHFEPIHCRKVFPCFDQPDLKASFDVCLAVKQHSEALSNMTVKSSFNRDDGYKTINFNTTPLMPTYLLAFAVGELEYTESSNSRVPLKVWSSTDNLDSTGFALQVAEKALDFYESKFGIDYPLPKLDLVSIPEMASPAMENFGLITFRENCLLADPQYVSTAQKKEIAETVFHEIAHQWFGNLVTIKSWDDLWLKEAFSNWISWFAIEVYYPEWKPWVSYLVYNLQNSLKADAGVASHPVKINHTSLHSIEQGFDSIVYDKGCSILTMVAHWLGKDLFLEGVAKFLSNFKWKSAEASDLWQILSQVSHRDVTSLMSTWLTQTGFPLVSVEEVEDGVEVSQIRFLLDTDNQRSQKNIYPVLLNVKSSTGVDSSLVLTQHRQKFSLELDDDFKINADHIGFYRTNYSDSRWRKLGISGTKGKISVEEKIGLLADCLQLAAGGYTSTINFLELIDSWANTVDHDVWGEISYDLYDILDAVMFTEVEGSILAYVQKLISQHLSNATEVDKLDSYEQKEFKQLIFSLAGSVRDPSIVPYCKEAFSMFLSDPTSICADQRITIFKVVAQEGGQDEFHVVLKLAKDSSIEEIQDDALAALAKFSDKRFVKEVLEMCLESFDTYETTTILRGLRSHRTGVEMMWNWIQENWFKIIDKVGYGTTPHLDIITNCVTNLSTKEHINQAVEFFSDQNMPKPDDVLNDTINSSLEKIKMKERWGSHDASLINEWIMAKSFEGLAI